MTVWICQCLCPDRHAIMATAGEAKTWNEALDLVRAPLRRQIVTMLRSGALNGHCAICNAHRATWRYELRPSKFATMDEAMPVLRQTEAENMAANLVFGDLHKTSKPN